MEIEATFVEIFCDDFHGDTGCEKSVVLCMISGLVRVCILRSCSGENAVYYTKQRY